MKDVKSWMPKKDEENGRGVYVVEREINELLQAERRRRIDDEKAKMEGLK
jgi:predicted RNA-binding protein YlxR (DUF448 family)